MSALAAMHVAKKQLGLDDDTYRAVCVRVTRKSSARDMTERERQAVVAEFRKQGFNPDKKGLQGPFAGKLQALWIAAWNLGLIRDRRDGAMLTFIKRQTKIEHTRFLLDAEDAAKAIEALKAWMAREAKVNWTVTVTTTAWFKSSGAKIAVAQWNILVATGEVLPDMAGFRKLVAEHARPLDQMTDRDWLPIMNLLGERVRRIKP